MTYKEAVKIKEDNTSLIGTTTEEGCTISELLIVPKDAEDLADFFRAYLFNNNAECSLVPYLYKDLKVIGIDSYRLKKYNVLVCSEIK